jgi:hypothetical protein
LLAGWYASVRSASGRLRVWLRVKTTMSRTIAASSSDANGDSFGTSFWCLAFCYRLVWKTNAVSLGSCPEFVTAFRSTKSADGWMFMSYAAGRAAPMYRLGAPRFGRVLDGSSSTRWVTRPDRLGYPSAKLSKFEAGRRLETLTL